METLPGRTDVPLAASAPPLTPHGPGGNALGQGLHGPGVLPAKNGWEGPGSEPGPPPGLRQGHGKASSESPRAGQAGPWQQPDPLPSGPSGPHSLTGSGWPTSLPQRCIKGKRQPTHSLPLSNRKQLQTDNQQVSGPPLPLHLHHGAGLPACGPVVISGAQDLPVTPGARPKWLQPSGRTLQTSPLLPQDRSPAVPTQLWPALSPVCLGHGPAAGFETGLGATLCCSDL